MRFTRYDVLYVASFHGVRLEESWWRNRKTKNYQHIADANNETPNRNELKCCHFWIRDDTFINITKLRVHVWTRYNIFTIKADSFIFSCAYSLAYSDEPTMGSSSTKHTRQIDRTSLLKPLPWMDTNHVQDQSLSPVRHSFQERT